MIRRISYFGIGLALFLNACSQKSDTASVESSAENSTVLVRNVSLNVEGGETATGFVNIESDREPKYNVFKLSDPDRIVVDMIDARLAEGTPTELMGQGAVSEVRVQSLEDSLSALVRVEIILASNVNYLASVEGSNLSIRLMSGAAEMPMAESSPAPTSEATPEADSFAQMPAPLPMPEPEVVQPSPELAPQMAMPESAPAPVPMDEPVAEAPAPQAESEMMAQIPPVESAPTPVPVPVPVPLPVAPEEKAPETMAEKMPELTPEAMPEPMPPTMPEAMPQGTERATPVMPAPREIGKNAGGKKIQSQEIPTSGLTEGTSLLTELDTKVYTGRRVSLEFQNADVQDVLRLIADVSKLNIITSDDVKGSLSLKLIDVPWDQALDIILTTLSLDKVQHGNIIRVAPAEKLKKERETALANDKAAKQLEPLKLKLLNINYAKGDEMQARIKNLLSERGTVDVDPRTNTLIVKDIKEHLSRIENLVRVLDTQTPQVRIESRIVQANDNFTRQIGVQWGPTLNLNGTNNRSRDVAFPTDIFVAGVPTDGRTVPPTVSGWAVDGTGDGAGTLGFRLGSVSSIFDLDLRLSYAELENIARVVSRPSISVLDNRTARIIQGTKIPFLSQGQDGANVSFQEAGIEISVTPQVTNDGSVMMKIATKSNEPASEGVGGNAIIAIREANTEMLVKSGRTAVLGGVFKTSETKKEVGVPGLKEIPVLGWLFKGKSGSRQREELLIFITPYILTDIRSAQTAPASDAELEAQ